jgi:uncharacterized protein YjiS (DUF1127 family)
MSSYAYTARPKAHALGTAFRTSIDRAWDGIALARAYLIEWRERVRSRSELMRLGAGDLSDIGCSRCDQVAEGSKPFWRV